MTEALEELGCRVLPSQANFVLVRPPGGDARRIYRQLSENKIFVRYFDDQPLDEMLRITIGSDKEQATLIDAIRPILKSCPQDL